MTREELAGLEELALDEKVHLAKCEEASQINSKGRQAQIDYLTGEDTVEARAERALLAALVFDAACDNTDSFEHGNVGLDLSYLLGAIVKNSFVEWERAELPELHDILRGTFQLEHPVWGFIAIFEPEKEEPSDAKTGN